MLHPVTAPALIIVGSLMARSVLEIPWSDPTEALPAFLTLVGIPLGYSIVDGIALGFISYVLLKAVTGQFRAISWISLATAVVFVVRFALEPAAK
jgi:AGZA family xanthine/uracil permease-like MFS transporter